MWLVWWIHDLINDCTNWVAYTQTAILSFSRPKGILFFTYSIQAGGDSEEDKVTRKFIRYPAFQRSLSLNQVGNASFHILAVAACALKWEKFLSIQSQKQKISFPRALLIGAATNIAARPQQDIKYHPGIFSFTQVRCFVQQVHMHLEHMLKGTFQISTNARGNSNQGEGNLISPVTSYFRQEFKVWQKGLTSLGPLGYVSSWATKEK